MLPVAAINLPLICPACRKGRRDMPTLSLAEVYRTAADGDVEEGALRCDNPTCARRYPIIEGVALVIPDLGGWQRGELAGVVEGPLHPATEALLAQGGPDDEPWPRMMEHLSTYLDAHWGDRAEPPPDGPAEVVFGLRALAEQMAARESQPVPSAVELGCSVGRTLALLARGAERVVGVDLHFGALRRARRLLRGEALAYARRISGRHYSTAVARAGELAAPAAVFVCADALDPPLAPAHFNRVAALNLLDSLRAPAQLLLVVDELCAPGGEVLLASPYGWRSGIVDEAARLGPDSAGELRDRFVSGVDLEARYSVEEEAELPWHLRSDARSTVSYRTHYLRLRKLAKNRPLEALEGQEQ